MSSSPHINLRLSTLCEAALGSQAMSNFDVVQEMDSAARAVAEVRARESGMSLAEWLEALIYQQTAPTSGRQRHVHGGSNPVWQGQSGSFAISAAIHPTDQWEFGVGYHPSQLLIPVIDTANLSRLSMSHGGHEDTWPVLQMISAFPPRISHAAILLSAAFAEADVAFRLPPHRPSARHRAKSRWYHVVVDTSVDRSREVRNALMHRWTPTGRAERLWDDAFRTLCDLTPARSELLILFQQDRNRASTELAKHLELATQQFELSANLLAEVEAPLAVESSEEQRFRELRLGLLERAGGGVSLTDGAELLGISRQALHKRIKSGTALGMMNGEELVLPRLQFVKGGGKVELTKGLSEVIGLFTRAGGWSALQFLVGNDPNLGVQPIVALNDGKVEGVVRAARAYLGLDEA